jgi:membrane associated rhomboid family serine protease
MFFPLHDGLPMRRLKAAFCTWAIIGLCSFVFLVMASGMAHQSDAFFASGLGAIPSVIFGVASLPDGYPYVPVWFTPVTSIFIHAGLAHLFGNMIFLWVFGDNVEDAMGHARFGVFFILCGVAGVLVHCLANLGSEAPLVGASGAISGTIAAYLMLHPFAKVFGVAFKFVPVRLPAYICLGAWVLLQFAQALMGIGGNIGWWAHVGGLITGAVMTPFFIKPDIRLFQAEVAS